MSSSRRAATAIALSFTFALGGAHAAQAPHPLAASWPGTIRLDVDATDIDHRIFRVREQVPVSPGPLTLLYPQWLPGKHAPRGAIDKLAGLHFSANGQSVAWKRDPLDVYAFQLEVPAGADRLDVEFEFLTPQNPTQGRVVVTPSMLNLQWEAVALYPAGVEARGVIVDASVRLPSGWRFAGALDVAPGQTPNAPGADGSVRFAPVPFATLVDSPLYAGRHFRRIDLAPGAKRPVFLDLVADDAKDLEAKPAQIRAHQVLVEQARKLYGSQHYDHYDFLLALSDDLGGIGLEHHRSSENSADPAYFTDWDKQAPGRSLLPHEYTHSWNGKFRRPADLATANFNTPMQGSLLWVYEGQTQYWGHVLSARSGLWSEEQARDALALVAHTYAENRPGFGWRDVQDTTNDPVVAARRPLPYRSWQMSEDYYNAGLLTWLAVDAKLRELSHERRSLDDFARAFFGVDDGEWGVSTYTRADVVTALAAIAPFDWDAFLSAHVEANAAPLDGLAAAGWKLVYTDSPSAYQRSVEADRKSLDLSASLGIVVGTKDGHISDVRWNGPAFKAGLGATGTLVAVDSRAFTPERLADAIKAAKGGGAPIELLVKDGDYYRTVRVDYHGGLKYPHLERIPGTVDRLAAIFAPRR
ncbi:M61 family metallopeptidase [Dokdonella fugitiva]|jgi:predicted metalloprotease with PDZ domain|uniref:Putative metalloprotease with PDZ domain n=1 Tax=Dokdonella fugitiva TaxID=328517 RepID=A0A4R2I6N1_9GAMM|nr:M61 family metallopeptidase [Dokdonella fugitiva]MBA8884326.1 putative metalloprotease with PDZ domain [Dokdonella fugitiva]TCO39933.1 putative metalloprotease with PDZ domain [Dokdonella fugitiva]